VNLLSEGQRRQLLERLGPALGLDRLRAGVRVRGTVHVQNANGCHRRFREWLARFHGVASRCLPNYLGWRWALDDRRVESPERFLRAALGMFNT